MMPIPKFMLPHSIEYRAYQGAARHGESYADPVTVDHVRVQMTRQSEQDNNVDKTSYDATVYIDCVNSTPHITPVRKSKITFGSDEMTATDVAELYADGGLHHYEVKCE